MFIKNYKNKFNYLTLFVGLISFSVAFTACNDDDDDDDLIPDTTPSTATSKTLFASNTDNGNLTIYDVSDIENPETTTLLTNTSEADGIYYNSSDDFLVQASRANDNLEGYEDVVSESDSASITIDFAGSSDMASPRGVAVNGDMYVVADNGALIANRFFVYQKSGNQFSLRNTITASFDVWGVTFVNDDLYAVVDNSNQVAIFDDFLSVAEDSALEADKTIEIENITRTHGITYGSSSNTLVMTDIGLAGASDDGAIVVIENVTGNFGALNDGDILTSSNQTRISGVNTNLGNPVDVALNEGDESIYVADAANDRILGFDDYSTGGNIAPKLDVELMGASSVYFEEY